MTIMKYYDNAKIAILLIIGALIILKLNKDLKENLHKDFADKKIKHMKVLNTAETHRHRGKIKDYKYILYWNEAYSSKGNKI